jgi:hypothetical protein
MCHVLVHYYCFLLVPILDKPCECQVIIISAAQASFNPGMLTACLAGLQSLVVGKHHEVVLPTTAQDGIKDSVVTPDEADSDDEADLEEGK